MPLNQIPFPIDPVSGAPYYDNKDDNNYLTMPVEQYIRSGGLFVPVSAANPLPSSDAATLAKLVEILAKLSSDPATETTLASILTQLGTTGLKKIIDALPAGTNLIGKTIPADADGDEKFTDANPATVKLAGPDGNPISTISGKLAVRASEIETQLTAIQGYIDGIETVLGTAVASPTAYTVLARLRDLATIMGEVQADPTANTILARIKSLEDKLAAIIAGTSPAVVQVSGSKMELYGASLDDRPDATTVPIGATFTIVDASQEFRSWMSNGSNWGEEI